MPTAVGYIRVSTTDQVENYSLQSQEDAIRAHCRREGLDLLSVFREEGESAKTVHRMKLRSMLDYCRDKKPGVVLVWKYDRLSRSLEGHIQIRSELQSLGRQRPASS